jgi:hypothetical protein
MSRSNEQILGWTMLEDAVSRARLVFLAFGAKGFGVVARL